MTTHSLTLKTYGLDSLFILLKKDIVLSVSVLLAAASCLISRPRIGYINFKVLCCLFSLMVVIKAFEGLRLLDRFAVGILNRSEDTRKVSLILILLCFFASMLVTNDIALITLVPLTLIISKKSDANMLVTVILQTLAANIGSSLTPMGNPQNLFIYSFYGLNAFKFFTSIVLFAVLGLIWLFILNLNNQNKQIDISFDEIAIKDRTKAVIWAILFAVIILSVFDVISYMAAVIFTLAAALMLDRSLIGKVDYNLLITFVCFFIFIGDISSIPALSNYMKTLLNNGSSTYFSSILLSQLISNVPCSILLSRFTVHWRALLLGVDIGGMGTLIASLASIISYKLFIKENPESSKKYIFVFTVYNVLSLLIFTAVNYFAVIR